MRITKKPNFKKYNKAIEKLSSKKGLVPAANEAIVGIQQRTQKGLDANNKEFTEYSPEYKKYKSKHFGTSKPNLTVTGNMLHSMTIKGITGGIRIYFGTAIENKKAFYNNKTRRFFGLTDKQRTKIKDGLIKYYKKLT